MSSVVIDTCVLRKANATLVADPREGRIFRHRLTILRRIARAG